MAWALRDTRSTRAQGSGDRPLVIALAIIPILSVLSMAVTVLLATQYFIDDVAISLGLLGAVFVVLLDLCLLVYLVGARLRKGQFAVAIKGGLLLIGLGLLIAPLVGVLPWSMRWLWSSSPWVPFLLRTLFAVWVIVSLIRIRKLPREVRHFNLHGLALATFLIAMTDSSAPRLVRDAAMLLMLVGLIWRGLATWKQRRARASAAGPA